MNHETLKFKLDAQREAVRGKTFSEASDLFKQIESIKVRLNLARDPLHYEKSREAWHAKRRGRAHA